MPTPVTVWFLELPGPAAFRPGAAPRRYRLERLAAPCPGFARFLYAAVGGPWAWTDRLPWTDAQWAARLAAPGIELWVATMDGAPAGYFELEDRADGTVEIAYFGLLPHAIGQGHGGALLTDAVERAWAMGARRVTVNTCSLDHPRALGGYRARGFVVVREEQRERP